ncbi:DNA-deoxyinosine glycosylase [Lentisphaerota bacterium ZTH]|nr:DNA-deoxyinosine glycosylase [Lentisphaerota bacterium]WET07622.1 DNA-deoxyinosine glycosylase [Lentisphaerota bacterium ZTH]
MKEHIYSFQPFYSADSGKLILGSMPGGESLRRQQYYAYPRNAFWKIMGELFEFDYQLPYELRIKALVSNGIALWDTVHKCVRKGSLDADITREEANDFEWLFSECPHIKKIFFNGQAAHKLFVKHCSKLDLPAVDIKVLPSTSPANAAWSYQKKLAAWRAVLS